MENGINILFPGPLDGDVVKKCESAKDLERNAIALQASLAQAEVIPNWIETEILERVGDTVDINMQYELRAIDFLEALIDYKNNIDKVQADLTLKIGKIIQNIKSDTVMQDLLSKVSAISSNEENASKIISEYCSLIDAAQQSITRFNENINQCINTFRYDIVPEIGKIVNRVVEISSKPNDVPANPAEMENTITEITKLTDFIKAQNQISNINRIEPMDQYSACLETSRNQCIYNLSTVLTKMDSIGSRQKKND